ncbi:MULTISPECIES: DNA cytosine methyltransferase [Mesorhizobium]|uniref:DNA cytosine methyltransferase n=1 Tax=Mesorhizobium TaxID=68287 RepID=UPI0010A95F0A|nr:MULTISPECIES: DNA cytosine methyltransferase [Mesorhizobium]
MNAQFDFGAVVALPPVTKKWRCLSVPGFMPAKKVPLPFIPPAKGERRIVAVDSFAGGGGASNGIAKAFRRLAEAGLLPTGHPLGPTYAINHDEAALAMHEANHRDTIHLPHNVWQVSMRETLGDNLFGFLWLSPDCRDHSTAKGGPITSRAVRDLAWVLLKWLKELQDWQRPWTICLENVGAFAKWSPLIERKDGTGFERDPERLGHTFHQFVHELARYGYSVGWDELVACEYGSPTIRKRLYLCARRDAARIVTPDRSHAAPKSDMVKSSALKPWPVAADILDFDIDCPSIFLTREEARAYTKATGKRIIRPLAVKTDARLAFGVKRHVLDAGDDAFIATCNHAGEGFRGQGLGEPFATVARARDAHGLVVPHMMTMRNSGSPTSSADEPTRTVMAGGANQFDVETYLAPCIVGVGGRMGQSAPRSVGQPWQSMTTKPDSVVAVAKLSPWTEGDPNEVDSDIWDRLPPVWRAVALKGLEPKIVAPLIAVFRGDSVGKPVSAPLPAVTANSFIKRPGGASPIGAVEAALLPFIKRDFGNSIGTSMNEPAGAVVSGGGGKMDMVGLAAVPFVSRGQHGGGNRSATQPTHTIAASDGDQNQVIVPYLVPRYGERDGQDPRTVSAERPLPTPVPDGNQGSLAAVYLAQHNTGEEGHSVQRPVSTIVQKGCTQGVVAAHMLSLKGSDRRDGSCGDAHPAICAGGQHSAVVTLPLMTAYYSSGGQHARVDDPSLTVPTKARFGLTHVEASPPPLTDAQMARARQVAAFLRRHGCWDGGDIVTLTIRGILYVIVDIGMRMLTPRELARAQGFPDSYILDPIYRGKPLTETEQRHKIGNSVCDAPAAAWIEANHRPPLEWGLQAFLEAAE